MSSEPKPKDPPGTQIVRAAELVTYQEGAVVGRVIVKKCTATITLFAFDEGEASR